MDSRPPRDAFISGSSSFTFSLSSGHAHAHQQNIIFPAFSHGKDAAPHGRLYFILCQPQQSEHYRCRRYTAKIIWRLPRATIELTSYWKWTICIDAHVSLSYDYFICARRAISLHITGDMTIISRLIRRALFCSRRMAENAIEVIMRIAHNAPHEHCLSLISLIITIIHQ